MFRWFPLAASVVLLAALVPSAAAADIERADWPQFRGPNRDDHSTDKGLITEWPKDRMPATSLPS